MRRKGQAAMEYLMTYGWAILVVLAIIAILAYVIKPQPRETCQTADPFQCVPGAYVTNVTSGEVLIKLKNIVLDTVKVTGTNCGFDDAGAEVNKKSLSISISPGKEASVTFDCSGVADTGATPGQDVFVRDVQVYYVFKGIAKRVNIHVAARYA